MFANCYKDKKVLITGHTGFKGTWLSLWLLKLGAEICGYSNGITTNPSMFLDCGVESKIRSNIGDVRSYDNLKKLISEFEPDIIFHLAAQAIVSTSYADPADTISTNVMGTVNILEAVRQIDRKCSVVLITSDKCYENIEQLWGYKETDQIGGKDIYSGSKGAAEILISSYFRCFFDKPESNIRIGIGRAGNVIGGGDWSKDRIVVDCMKRWGIKEAVEIRSPYSTRPWQHVLEPISGYLTLGMNLIQSNELTGEAFNFGPNSIENKTVLDLIKDLAKYWDFSKQKNYYNIVNEQKIKEAGLLKLNCEKANSKLKWVSTLLDSECIEFTSIWYSKYFSENFNPYEYSNYQIEKYQKIAKFRSLEWSKDAI